MKLIEIDGDLVEIWLKREIDVGFHQANCFNNFGSGLALQVKKRIPDAQIIDSLTVRGDPKKLGQFSAYEKQKERQVFINLYGQYRYGKDKQYTDYDALFSALTKSCEFIQKLGYSNERLGFPYKLGAGTGGGNWEEKIFPMIKYVFEETDFEVYIIKLKSKNKKLD